MIYKIIKRSQYELLALENCARKFPAHIHKRLCAIAVSRGEKYITVGAQTTKCVKGDLFIVPPLTAHSCYSTAKTNYSVLSICLDDSVDYNALSSDLSQVGFDVKNAIESIKNAINDFKRKTSDFAGNLLSYIDEESVNGLTIAQVAKKAGYSADHISRLFKNAIGISLHRYIILERIRRAKHRAKRDLISEIAQDSGFYDQSHFIRHFKRYEGVTPKAYYQSLLP